jgi:outer membrane autotransporter protein
MSAKTRFLNSVSGIALTAALVAMAMPARADTDDASGSAMPFGPGFNQNHTVTTVPFVEAESSDSSNAVEVTGIVFGNAAFNHLNAIGVYVNQWDIEASEALDTDSGLTASALAVNEATISGSIIGTVINPDFAPGTGSYGVRVADDIQAETANSRASYDGGGDPSVTSIARNSIFADGEVAGSAINSFGVRVDGEVHSTFANAQLRIDNYTDPTDIAFGSAQALNFVAITGTVGGEGASDGSFGFYVGGDVYADDAAADGGTFVFIEGLNVNVNVASVWSSGTAAADILASNTVALAGAVIGDGGNLATGVYVGGNVFAEGAWAAGEAISDGGQNVASAAYIEVEARNTVVVEGAVSGVNGPATGVEIVGDVWAEDAAAIGEAIAAFNPGYYNGGTPSAQAEIVAIAVNAVSITGLASADGGTGVVIGGSAFAEGASAEGFAGVNLYELSFDVPEAAATATAHAANVVVVTGTAEADNAKGVDIGGDIFANDANADAYATAYAEFVAVPEGVLAAVTANASVVATASNAIAIVGIVDPSLTNAQGVDPLDVYATNANAYGNAYANALSNGGAGATATATSSIAATNSVGVSGSIGDGASGSTGVLIDQAVYSEFAYANGYASADATQLNGDTLVPSGANATAGNTVLAYNSAVIEGTLGNSVDGSTGVNIGYGVDAYWADAYGSANAYSTVDAGGVTDSVASAEGSVSALNEARILGVVGTDAFESAGVVIGEGVYAAFAFADGYSSANSYNSNGLGSANATADNFVRGENIASATGGLGDNAVDSTGVRIGWDIEAYNASADGNASAYANVFAPATSNGDATATATNQVRAGNGAVATGILGNVAEGSTGLWVGEDVDAVFAEASGSSRATATIYGGNESDATATSDNDVSAGNIAAVLGIVGDDASGSLGVYIGEGVTAAQAFAEGYANANAYNDLTGGNATATASNTIAARNTASVTGFVGNNAQWANDVYPDGVYIGEGVTAVDAFAEGSAYASANLTNGEGDGIASATANNTVVAANSASITGTIGTGAEGAGGVYIDGTNFVFGAFGPPVFAGVAAMNAFAEGSAYAEANGTGGTGAVQATATNNVAASNGILIVGSVGADGSEVVGVGIDEGLVVAAFAEAIGNANAYATKSGGNGDATAQVGGTIVASNGVGIGGSVGDASYNATGVYIGEGPVVAGLAEGAGNFYASANRNGVENGNATAGVGTSDASAIAAATNLVAIGGTVSGINGEGGGVQENFGVWIGEGVGAIGALAEGSFGANAWRNDSGNGTASASVHGGVVAANDVLINGLVTAGTTIDGAYVGEGSSGVFIGGDVVALGALAQGNGYANAYRQDGGTTGDAIAASDLGVVARNQILIGGEVGSFNDESTGVHIGEGVTAAAAFADGSARAYADNTSAANGVATATATLGMFATNNIAIGGEVGTSTLATSSDGVWIGEGVTATLAFAEGSADATAYRNGAGNGNATATAGTSITASNLIGIGGTIGDNINDGSVGVYIGDGVSASLAFAEGTASAYAEHVGPGTGIATAAALSNVAAANIVGIAGTVGVDSWFAYGVDPLFVNASDATAISSASATANGPAGSTAIATATATASNIVDVNGTVATQHNNGVGVWILGDVTALNAFAEGSTNVTTSGSATGTGTATATAFNLVDLTGSVAANGDGSTGIYIGNNVVVGGLGVSLSNYADAGAGTTITSTATGAMYNVVTIAGDVGSGVNATNSTGVHIGGNVEFGGINSSSLNSSLNGAGDSTALQVVEAGNFATITGAVGTTSSGSHGVWIGGNVEVTNDLVSTFIIEGSDATNDGTTRGVYIGGSVLTGDALNSQYDTNADNNNAADPAIPAPLQIGDYVELAGSVFIGADGGLNPHGVAVGGGNDTVLVRDTHFQMEVVNGFDGGSNPSPDGQDVITFSNAQIFVSNIDNFELMNVTNTSFVILTNPSPYIYAVRDQVNINVSSVLSFGDGGAPPPFPIANGAPVNAAEMTTEVLTIGGINGVKSPGPGFDDSILKAENNGTGSYVINADNVYNFGTITLSKVLSALRGTDPHALDGLSATSFDTAAEQQYWAVTGSWNIDPSSGPGDFLQINANYTAGSDVILDTFVFKSTSPSDVVEINGNVAGVTTVWINNTNTTGTGAFTGNGPNDGILVVDVNNGQDPNVVGQAFVLGNTSGWNWADPVNFPEPEMQVGAFVYTLNQGGPDDRNFYLRSQLLDQVPAYTVMTSAIQQHFYAELGTLYQRMGELRHADLGSKANTSFFEFWMRAYGQDVNMDPKEGFEFDMTSKGFMIGGDYAVRNWLGAQSRLHLGGFGGYGWTKLDDIKGEGAVGNSDGKTDGYTLGLYATYFDTAKKHQGLYADAVVKFNFLDSEYSSSTRDTKAKSDDFAWGASLELGYGIGLGNGFIIQPQGQLSYMQVSKEKFKESSSPGIPLEVERDKGESLRGRLGLQLQNTWVTSGGTQFSPYIIGNVLHEFMGDNKTTVSGTPFHNDMGGTWYNAGAGFTVDFDNVGLYGHIEYNFGERIEGLAAGLGVKIKLGGSSPVAAAAPPPAPPAAPKKNYIVFFDFDRSNITADAQRVIDEAATAAKAGNSARVQLTGHTDRSGSEQYNMALSMRRGEAVKQAMIARGIPANSIVIISRGESQPLVPTADGVREPQNRRVEIVL